MSAKVKGREDRYPATKRVKVTATTEMVIDRREVEQVSHTYCTTDPQVAPTVPLIVQSQLPKVGGMANANRKFTETTPKHAVRAEQDNQTPKSTVKEAKGGGLTAAKPSGSLHCHSTTAALVAVMPNKVNPKPPTKTFGIVRASQGEELSLQMTTIAGEKVVTKAGGAKKGTLRASTARAEDVQETPEDSNPYSIDDAIDGLQEVSATSSWRSPRK